MSERGHASGARAAEVAAPDGPKPPRARRARASGYPSSLTRDELLAEGAAKTGEGLVLAFREALRLDGRAASGGWPGTLGEARARIEAHLAPLLSRRKMVSLTREELDLLTHATYAHAKRGWLSNREPEAPEPR